jgi:hypothetical protein
VKSAVVFAFALVALVGTPGRASAQFSTLDRQTASTDVGADFTYLFVNHDKLPGTTGYRFDVYGQFVEPTVGFGGYISEQLTHASFDVDTGIFQIRGSGTGVGDVELGGIYVFHARRDDLKLVFHAGLTLPTGPSTASDSAQALALGSLSHITDTVQTLPSGTSVRLGLSPIWHRGNLVARIDVGLDVNLSIADGRNTLPPLLRIDGALGFANETFSVMGELTNVFITGDSNDGGNTTLNEAAVSTRFFLGQGMSVSAALVLPLEDDTKNLDLGLQFGFLARFR